MVVILMVWIPDFLHLAGHTKKRHPLLEGVWLYVHKVVLVVGVDYDYIWVNSDGLGDYDGLLGDYDFWWVAIILGYWQEY